MFFSLIAREPVKRAAKNIIKKVTGYPLSYARSVNSGSVNRKLNTRTLTIDEIRLYILWVVITDVIRTPRTYIIIILASSKPRCRNSIPRQLAAIRIAVHFKISEREKTIPALFLAFLARYALALLSASGIIWTSRFGAFIISFSVSDGLLNMVFLVAELLPITIFDTPESLANSAIWKGTSSPYTVSIFAPSCPARRILALSLFISSSGITEKSGVSTKSAVNAPLKALAILAAVRIILAFDGEDERQTRICSSV